MTLCYLIRHAHAGKRGTVDDDLRPLSERGTTQARAIAESLAGSAIARIVSSPLVRCVETVVPIAPRSTSPSRPTSGSPRVPTRRTCSS